MAEAKKQEKEGFFRRTGKRISKWFREMRAELKKVVWPTKKQVLQNTVVVLISVLVIGVFIWIFDAISNLIVQWLIGLFN
ncbi:MAG: preprotein translocase subunit SecE [Oscillospiraceae bacterium]|nr:preprotein translocase subunit SecE [Oscillospiraceae bacterium]